MNKNSLHKASGCATLAGVKNQKDIFGYSLALLLGRLI
jgi:hypothetical protein